jgi:hypothetical protein
MALPNLIVSAVAEWNGKALSKGASQISKFDKTVKNLGRTLGVTFSAAAVLGYSKKAVAAYGEQIAEAKRLDQALRNLGFSFATSEAEGYIDSIEKATGVNRDQLQPSFIQLAQVTRSTTIAQSMLNTALDVSAGTGMDLAGATKILSQAYVGNLKGLRQLNLGLTQAELASKSYLEIEKLIAVQYAGQSKNAADSYAGSVARLKIAAEEASEQIGQSLVAALGTSSGGMDKLIDKVDGASNSISGLITNTAYLTKELGNLFSSIPGAGVLENSFRGLKNYLGRFSIGALRNNVDRVLGRQGGFPQGVPADIKNMQSQTEKTKMDKEALKRQKELIALQKKAQLAEKNKLSLSKAAAVFDTNRISIAAALKATYDKETRLRLEALMAIEDEDGATALARIGELAAFQKNADLQKLAGVKTISSATLEAINTQLLAELKVIDASKMAEADKEAARQIAFGKYNAALTAAGELAEKNSYTERVQIQLTEIARLASLSKTSNAAITATTLREQAEINMIDRVAAAQKEADEARKKALEEYIRLLNSIGSGGKIIPPTTITPPSAGGPFIQTPNGISPTTPPRSIEAINKAVEDIGGVITVIGENGKEFTKLVDGVAPVFQAIEDSGAFNALVNSYAGGAINSFNSGSFRANEGSGSGTLSRGGAFDRDIVVNVSAGVISQPDEFAALLQETIQKINRDGDPLFVAGTL